MPSRCHANPPWAHSGELNRNVRGPCRRYSGHSGKHANGFFQWSDADQKTWPNAENEYGDKYGEAKT